MTRTFELVNTPIVVGEESMKGKTNRSVFRMIDHRKSMQYCMVRSTKQRTFQGVTHLDTNKVHNDTVGVQKRKLLVRLPSDRASDMMRRCYIASFLWRLQWNEVIQYSPDFKLRLDIGGFDEYTGTWLVMSVPQK